MITLFLSVLLGLPVQSGQVSSFPQLIIEDMTPDQVIARAVHTASQGDVHGAVGMLQSMDDGKGGPFADDVKLLRELALLSDQVLETYKKNGKYLLVQRSQRYVGKVTEFNDLAMTLKTSGGRSLAVPRSELDPAQLVRLVKQKKLNLGNPALLASALVLCGKSAKEAVRTAGGGDEAALRQSSKRWKSLMGESRAHKRIVRLASMILVDSTDPLRALSEIDSLLGSYKDSRVIQQYRDQLKLLGSALLERAFESSSQATSGLRAASSPLQDGRVELHYDFEDGDQLRDFRAENFSNPALGQFDKRWREVREKVKKDGADLKGDLREGALVLTTGTGLHHVARFQEGVEIEFTASVKIEKGNTDREFIFLGILSDNGQGNVATCDLSGGLWVENVAEKQRQIAGTRRRLLVGHEYTAHFTHNNGEYILVLDGWEDGRAKDMNVTEGRLGFLVYGGLTVSILDLKIRGRLDSSFTHDLKVAWIAQREKRWQ